MEPKIHSPFARAFYFWVGIVSTLAYRIVVILTHVDPIWLKISWYIGTVGFIIYFAHRYQISERRSNLIKENNLVEKIKNVNEFTQEDKAAIDYIFSSLQSTKEKWNYIFIFVSSALALIIGIYLDVIIKLLK